MDTVTIHDSVDSVAAPWAKLAEDIGAAPFLWPGWIAAWLRAFNSCQLRLYAVWRKNALVGLAPLLSRGNTLLSPTNAHTPLFGLLAQDATASESLVRSLLEDKPRHVDLGYVDPHCAISVRYSERLRERGYRFTQAAIRSPATETTSDWNTYQQGLSKNRRKGLGRNERRLREQGELRVEIHDGAEKLDELLAEGYRVEASGWKGDQGTAILSRAATREFYSAVARWAAEQGWLQLAFLRLDGRAIAFEFLLRHDDVIYDLKGGYDDDYKKWGPGVLLTYWLLKETFSDANMRSFEWLGEADPYKLEWSDVEHDRQRMISYAPSVAGVTTYFRHRLKGHAKGVVDRWLPEAINERLTDARIRRNRQLEYGAPLKI